MYKTVLIDDDPLSQETLKDLLEIHFKDFNIVGIYSSVKETLAELPKQEVDLVFLDMELLDGLGFDILKELKEIQFEVIVITMHDSFMLDAIKHSAIDYLMKPINKSDIAAAINRFEKRIIKFNRLPQNENSSFSKSNKLAISHQNGLVLLDFNEIVRLESDGAYTKLYVTDGKSYFTSKNIGFYETQLLTHNFFRVHHGHLINLLHVKSFLGGIDNSLVMSDNSSVNVSRRRKEEFLKVVKL